MSLIPTQKTQKSVAQQIRQRVTQLTFLEEKRCKQSAGKQKNKGKSIEDWSVNIHEQVSLSTEKTPRYSTPMDDGTYEMEFSQLLGIFIQSIVQEKHQKHLMRRLFYKAQTQPTKNLWHYQYTNKLSLAICLLGISTQKLSKQLNSPTKPLQRSSKKTQNKQQPQNQNASNIQSQHSDDDNSPKNRKRKQVKKNNKRVELSPPRNKKDREMSDNEERNSANTKHKKRRGHSQEEIVDENSLLNKESKLMIEEINGEINRVEDIYFSEMEQYHALPYLEVDVMIQKNLKSAKASRKYQAGKLPQTQGVYPFQESQYKFNPTTSNNNTANFYPLSTMYPQRLQAPIQEMPFANQLYPFNSLNAPQINALTMPFMQMNPTLTQINQQIGQFGHSQSMINHQVFGNGGYQGGNGFYDANLMMMNMNGFGPGGSQQQQSGMKNQKSSGNNSSAKKVIMIENIDED